MSDSPQVPQVSAQSGLSDNAAGALAYVTFIPAIIFLLVEPYNRNSFVKFHSWQSIFLGIAAFAIDMVLTVIPVVGWIIIPFVGLGFLVLWIIVILKAHEGRAFPTAHHRQVCRAAGGQLKPLHSVIALRRYGHCGSSAVCLSCRRASGL